MKSKSFWRKMVYVLAAANVLFWLWHQGYLRIFGLGPKPVQEPHRIENQIDPDLLILRPVASEPKPASQPE